MDEWEDEKPSITVTALIRGPGVDHTVSSMIDQDKEYDKNDYIAAIRSVMSALQVYLDDLEKGKRTQ